MDSPLENVADTAFWIAQHRAAESTRPDGLFRDPLSIRLAGERGRRIAAAMPAAAQVAWHVAVRTRVIDEFLAAAVNEGADTVLNLGAGLDARPYRLPLPAALRWIEADQPALIEYKEVQLAGEEPRCALTRVKLDLADGTARRALLAGAAKGARRLAVLTEGVVPYLTEEQAGALAGDLAALGCVEWWITDYFSPRAMKYRERMAMARAMRNAPFRFKPADPFAFYERHGWQVREIRYLPEEGARLGRPMPLPLAARAMMRFWSLFLPRARREAFLRFTGYMLLAPGRKSAGSTATPLR